MSVFRHRHSRYWQYKFVVRGIEFRGSTKVEDKEQAQGIAAKLRTDVILGQHFPRRETLTLDQGFKKYYSEVGEHLASASDVDYQLSNLARVIGGCTTFDRIDDAVIARFVDARRRETARHTTHPVSPATVNREIELLRRVLNRARKTWKISAAAEPDWKALKLVEPDGRERHASDDELTRIHKAMEEIRPELRAPAEFSVLSGVREMNCLRLKWEQVAVDRITFWTKSKKPGGKIHVVAISKAIRRLLDAQSGIHEEFVFTYVSKHPKTKGQRKPFTKTGWRKDWKKILKKARVVDFRWHDFRHTAGTRFYNATKDPLSTQRFMGHADAKSTARYVHDLSDMVANMDQMARRISAVPENRKWPNHRKRKVF